MTRLVLALGMLMAATLTSAAENVTYAIDAKEYEGYAAKSPGTSKGLVIIIHTWNGLKDYERTRADMLAEMGYDAFAIDLYGKGNRPEEASAKKAEVGKLYDDREKMRALILGGLAEARTRFPGSAVIMGYCFGGSAALELARSGQAKDVKGYATFHGGLKAPESETYPSDTPPLLIAHGGADASISMDDVATLSKRLEADKVTYEIDVYSGAPHGFTEFGTPRYQARADERSWVAFKEFLERNLGG